ncbi:uncharacterized protein LOC112198969 [Rosa chinensis]|uniref:uncharacterized protein LOC112198969 n=1 Tax=Rosa chinensis TaxID=74649 RepID=UPI000D08BCC9|nr:uncharacterized protein LOC112198969 [Rosa chinensis]
MATQGLADGSVVFLSYSLSHTVAGVPILVMWVMDWDGRQLDPNMLSFQSFRRCCRPLLGGFDLVVWVNSCRVCWVYNLGLLMGGDAPLTASKIDFDVFRVVRRGSGDAVLIDRTWMVADRRSREYKLGVIQFCKFALYNARDLNHISCPCTKCGNVEYFSSSVIRDHLFINGIDESYDKWIDHGEAVVDSGTDEDTNSMEYDSDQSESVQCNEGAEYEVELGSDMELEDDEDEGLSNECNEFRQFVDNANKPLYPGCDRHTKLNVLVSLYNLKAKHGMSDSAYSDWLITFAEFLPVGNEIPASVYDAKKTLSALGMDYTKIHACPNDCILYRKEYVDETKYPRCGLSRWKIGKNSKERDGVPAKLMVTFLGVLLRGIMHALFALKKTKPTRLVNGGKMAYIGHRRFLGINHPYRKQKAAFNNFPEHSPPPVPLTGEEVLCRVEEEVEKWPFGKKYPHPPYKGAKDETRPCWKKSGLLNLIIGNFYRFGTALL